MRISMLSAMFAFLACAAPSRADKPAPPGTYKESSADGKLVFVMISPESLEQELSWYNEDHQKVVTAIRQTYAKSGLYKNDGSKTPLWTVDWYSHSVHVASDGVHLVRQGPWPTLAGRFKDKNRTITKGDLHQEAFSLFAKGKLLRKYSIGELVDEPRSLPLSVSHFQWLKEAQILDAKNHLEITTLDGNRVLVDLATARILEKKQAK